MKASTLAIKKWVVVGKLDINREKYLLFQESKRPPIFFGRDLFIGDPHYPGARLLIGEPQAGLVVDFDSEQKEGRFKRKKQLQGGGGYSSFDNSNSCSSPLANIYSKVRGVKIDATPLLQMQSLREDPSYRT